MRLLAALLFAFSPLYACSCLGTGTPCSSFGGSSIVFVARVLVDSGEGWGNRPARVLIEEKLLNVPQDLKEVEIDTSAGTSCYRRLQEGKQYVIFAFKREDKTPQFSIGACSVTFEVEGNEHILEALRNKAANGPSRLVGKVLRSKGSYSRGGALEGAHISARSNEDGFETVSDGSGHYEFRGIPPGQYQLEVSRPGFVPDQEFNRRWSGRLFSNKESHTLGPDATEPRGSITIGAGSCAVWDLSMWPQGRITGTVRNEAGQPLPGVTVQAFDFDAKGRRESRPLRTGISDETGRYRIEPLPEGEYVVGVNAEKYTDADPFPPTFYRAAGNKPGETRIAISESAEQSSIDLTVPPRRIPATLQVQVITADGSPYAGASVKLLNAAGIERGLSKEHTSKMGLIHLNVYQGEQYTVEAFAFDSSTLRRNREYDYLGGSASLTVLIPGPQSDNRPCSQTLLGGASRHLSPMFDGSPEACARDANHSGRIGTSQVAPATFHRTELCAPSMP
ncbi:MAG: carboxypeptidase-like regulatory domain-containing protein [Paludibaculum sp.]